MEGWDWTVPVPDRNTGIWDEVDIRWTGPVLLQVLLNYRLNTGAGGQDRSCPGVSYLYHDPVDFASPHHDPPPQLSCSYAAWKPEKE